MERHDTARPEMGNERTERPGGILEIHQHEPADDRVEASVRRKGLHIRDGKVAPAKSLLSGSCRRAPYRIRGTIDAEHAPRRPDQPRCKKGNVAWSATDVEHVHSDADSGAPEDLFGARDARDGRKPPWGNR